VIEGDRGGVEPTVGDGATRHLSHEQTGLEQQPAPKADEETATPIRIRVRGDGHEVTRCSFFRPTRLVRQKK
jgi:hypothetical protein